MTIPNRSVADAVRESAMLARIRCKALGLTRTDKDASRRTVSDHQSVEGAARVVVSRLPGVDDLHRRIVQAQNDARQALREVSAPWNGDDGFRLLPNARYLPLLDTLGPIRTEFDAAMHELTHQVDDIIAKAKANLGGFQVDVPTRDELLGAYTLEDLYQPIPDSEAFRSLPPEVQEKLSRQLDAQVASAVEAANRDTLERLLKPTLHLAERLKAFSERERALAAGESVGRHGVFRDSVLGNLQGLVRVLADLDVVGDARVADIRKLLQPLADERLTPDVLRDNAKAREAVAKRADVVAARLREWLEPVAPAHDEAA
jgi:hypothetical protein